MSFLNRSELRLKRFLPHSHSPHTHAVRSVWGPVDVCIGLRFLCQSQTSNRDVCLWSVLIEPGSQIAVSHHANKPNAWLPLLSTCITTVSQGIIIKKKLGRVHSFGFLSEVQVAVVKASMLLVERSKDDWSKIQINAMQCHLIWSVLS